MKTLVVIPAYNEALNIEKTVHDLEINAPDVDYVVVNDGSKDNTLEVLKKNHFNYIDGFCNLGLFGAVQTGFKLALKEDYDVVIVSVYYQDGYDDSGATYDSKSNFHGFTYYSYLCNFYTYHGVKANSVFKDKCVPGQNAGISVLAFNVE